MPDEWRAQMELRAANQIIGREKRLHPERTSKISGCGSSTAWNRELRTERSFEGHDREAIRGGRRHAA